MGCPGLTGICFVMSGFQILLGPVFFLGPFLPAVVLGPGLGLSLVFIETVKSCMTTQRTLAASTGHARFGFRA